MKRKVLASLLILAVILAVVGLVACNKASDSSANYRAPSGSSAGGSVIGDYYESGRSDSGADVAEGSTEEETTPERKIIYTVYESITVDNPADAVTAVKGKLNADEWLDSESSAEGYAYLVVRVKTDRLDSFVEGLSSIGEVSDYEKTGRDISINYADNAERIATLNAEREKLVELYASASNMSEILQINTRISQVDSELASLNGTQKRYDSLIEYSTVNITIYQKGYVEEKTFGDRLEDAFGTGWRVAESVFIFILVAIPFAVVIAIIVVGIIHLRRFGKRKKKSKKTPDDDRMDHIV